MQRLPLRGPAKQGRPFSARAVKGGDKQVYSDGSERDCAQQTFEGFPPPEEGEGYSYSAGFGYLGGPQEGKGRGKSELQIQEIHRQANILGFAILLSIFLSNASFFLLTRLFALLSSGVGADQPVPPLLHPPSGLPGADRHPLLGGLLSQRLPP